MSPATADTLLKWLLRLSGGVELLAVPFIAFPLWGMNAIHDRWLGLGPMPQGTIVEYLARTLSVVYAMHGAVLIGLSMNVDRYRPLIRLVGQLHMAAGVVFLVIDLASGMPWWWTLCEGPPIAAGGYFVYQLARRGMKPAPSAQFTSSPASPR